LIPGKLRSNIGSISSIVLSWTVLLPVLPAAAVEAWAPDVQAIERSGFDVDYTQGNELLYVREEGGTNLTGVYSRFAVADYKPTLEVCTDFGASFDCNKEYVDPDADPEAQVDPKVVVQAPPVSIGGTALLPYCGGKVESCIESLEIGVGEEEEFLPAIYSGTTSSRSHFVGNPSVGVPSGVGPAIFNSEAAHSGGTEYTVKAALSFDYRNDQSPANRFDANEFSLRVFATVKTTGGYGPAQAEVCQETPDNKGINPCGNETQGCVYQDNGVCGVEHDLAMGTSFRVSMILTNELTGWFRGRLKAPNIEVVPIDAGYSRVVISGDPVEVPRFLATFSLAQGDPDVVGPLEDNGHGGSFTLFEAASPRAMEIVQGMRERVNDTAAGVSTVWSVNSISANRATAGQGSSKCLSDSSGLLGLVTTNSMTYLGTVPSYSSGFLGYKVAGLHYAPDGETLNLGTYDLVMRSDVARCLYGFSRAPISATVSVVGDKGEEYVATTIVSEKDGWLKLAAYGFTFSEKEIQVQLRQSQIKTLTNFISTSLSAKQKAEIRSVLSKSEGNTKFICTGIRYFNQPVSENIRVRARAKAACDYAKSINPDLSYWYQTKTTKARSYNGKVMVVSKG
jgi:hypothetical protein